jgi:hypothetical protein
VSRSYEFWREKIWREFLAGKLQFLLAKSTENLLQYTRTSLEGTLEKE